MRRGVATAVLLTALAAAAAGDARPRADGPIVYEAQLGDAAPYAELVLVDPLTGTRTVPAPTPADAEDEPEWSPAGERIAYASGGELVVSRRDGSGRAVVDRVAWRAGHAWSPDGSRLAYGAGKELRVADLRGGVAVLAAHDAGVVEGVGWSSDGTLLAYELQRDLGIELRVVRADGGGEVAALAGEDPRWRPGSAELAYASADGIRVWSAGGAERTLVGASRDRFRETGAWSPDGARLALVLDATVYVAEGDGSWLRPITEPTREQLAPGDPAWSPGGDEIAVVVRDPAPRVVALAADGSGARTLVAQAGCRDERYEDLAWSPDGSRVALVLRGDEDPELWSVAATGGAPVRLTRNCLVDARPAVSPDGRRIAFFRFLPERGAWGLHVREPDGRERLLAAGTALGVERPAWSRDGRRLAFTTRAGLRIVPAAGGRARTVVRAPRRADVFQAVSHPSFSPDGRRLVFESRGRLAVVGVDGTGRRELTRTGRDAAPAWSPDGRLVAFARRRLRGATVDVWLLAADGTRPRRVAANASAPAWSPDGSRLAFLRREDVWSARRDGRDVRRLTDDGAPKASPSWAPP